MGTLGSPSLPDTPELEPTGVTQLAPTQFTVRQLGWLSRLRVTPASVAHPRRVIPITRQGLVEEGTCAASLQGPPRATPLMRSLR